MSDRTDLAALIAARLDACSEAATEGFATSGPSRHFVVDDLLPAELCAEIHARFPPRAQLMARHSLREKKGVGIQMQDYDPLMEAITYAFLEPKVVERIGTITGMTDLCTDQSLYASGLSRMEQGDFLNPHLDNSHDGDGRRYRALNLLYYVTPGWGSETGGNLELWDPDVRQRTELPSLCNRLVVMETGRRSWHSVNKVQSTAARCCISNYYFCESPPGGKPYRHVTTFTGRPEETGKRALLWATDSVLLNAVGRSLPFLTRRSRHRRRD